MVSATLNNCGHFGFCFLIKEYNEANNTPVPYCAFRSKISTKGAPFRVDRVSRAVTSHQIQSNFLEKNFKGIQKGDMRHGVVVSPLDSQCSRPSSPRNKKLYSTLSLSTYVRG